MKARTYSILSRAIEDGIRNGWTRSHKHTDNPDKESIVSNIQDCIMLEITENFSFDEDE